MQFCGVQIQTFNTMKKEQYTTRCEVSKPEQDINLDENYNQIMESILCHLIVR